MSYALTGNSGSAGNASYATIYTSSATASTVIGNISAYNSAVGALTLTLGVTRQNGTTYVLAVDSVNSGVTVSYGKGATKCVCPLTLLPGEILKAQGSSTGLTVTASGVAFS